jgi:hypothetical protein
MLCRLMDKQENFRRNCCLHFQDRKIAIDVKTVDWSEIFVDLPDYAL